MKIFDPKLTGSIEILNTISGNVTIAGGLTVEGSLGGSATTASYVEYSDIANKPTLISSSAQLASDISGSFSSTSSSLSQRIAPLEVSVSSLNSASSSYALEVNISGSLGVNATLIRSLTAAGITGSVTSLSSSIAGNLNTKLNIADTGSFAKTNVNNNFGGLQTFNNVSITGTGSFAYIQSITGSAKIIGDSFIVVNNNTPAERYGGLSVYDSGSAGTTGSLFFDGQLNDWNYEYTTPGGTDYGTVLFGPEYSIKGSPTYPANNKLQKGSGTHHLANSNVTDTGTLIVLGSNTQVTGSLGVSGGITGTLTGNASTATSASYAATGPFLSSYTETDTLATVTARGAITTADITVGDIFSIKGSSPYIRWQNSSDTRLGYIQHNETNLVMSSDTGDIVLDPSSGTVGITGSLSTTGNIEAYGGLISHRAPLGGSSSEGGELLLRAPSNALYTKQWVIDAYTNKLRFVTEDDGTGANGAELGYLDTSGNLQFDGTLTVGGASGTINGNTIWHAGNDGAGSGLDADTVDGIQAASFLRNDSVNTGTLSFSTSAAGTTTTAKIFFGQGPDPAGSLNTGANNFAGYGIDGYGLILQAGYGTSDMGGIKITDDGVIVFGASDENLFTVIDEDGNTVRFNIDGSGNIQTEGTIAIGGASGTINGNTILHAGNYTSYSPSLNGSGASGTWGISITGTSEYATRALYGIFSDTRNAASTPETQNASNGVRFDFKTNTTNGLSDGGTYNGVIYLRKYGGSSDWSGGGAFEIAYTDNQNLWTRYGTGTSWNSWRKIWSSGNDGAGSGLDADTLDGFQASEFIKSSESITSDLTINDVRVGRGPGNVASNTIVGKQALNYTTTGGSNTALGSRAMYCNTTGYENVAVGNSALYGVTRGFKNTAVGLSALAGVQFGNFNTAVGHIAGGGAAGSSCNTAVGTQSLMYNNRNDNTAVGAFASQRNSLGYRNTAIGSKALRDNKCSNSTAVGYQSLYRASTGNSNTAVGAYSLKNSTTGVGNTSVGICSLCRVTTGSSNIAIGRTASQCITTGNNNIGIGCNVGAAVSTASNTISVGTNSSTSNVTNHTVWGNSNNNVCNCIWAAWSTVSDFRDKANIKSLPPQMGLDLITKLRPVSFNWDSRETYVRECKYEYGTKDGNLVGTKEHYGLIAQELQSTLQALNLKFDGLGHDDEKDAYRLTYEELIAPMIKAIQELNDKVDQANAEIEILKARQ